MGEGVDPRNVGCHALFMSRTFSLRCLLVIGALLSGCHDPVSPGLEVTGAPSGIPGVEGGEFSEGGGFDCACQAEGACDGLAADLDACQEAVCDVKLCRCVALLVANATACSDGDPCTLGTFCVNGACIGGTAFECEDGNPCTEDLCTGTDCAFPPASGPCDDGDPCTQGDACAEGLCAGQVPEAGCPCTEDEDCALDAPDACLLPATCVAGACEGGGLRVCDDGDACTTDYCDPEIGCTREIEPPCAVEDGNPCTLDGCDPETGCFHLPLEGTPCQDGLDCNGSEICAAGECIGEPCPCVEDASCENSANPCSETFCDPLTSTCVAVPATGECEDGNPCTEGTSCVGYDCLGGVSSCPPDHCCEPHSSPGCPNDWLVQICTCHYDPFCCAVAWDLLCVSTAETQCDLECPDAPGECCATSIVPGCSEESCATCVCAGNPECCAEGWGTECMDAAEGLCAESCACADDGEGSSCCEESPDPGCSNPACQDCVCDVDAYCCAVQWDEICVEKGLKECAAPCAECVFCGNGTCEDGESCIDCPLDCGGCVGFCCALHPYPGCFDAACQGCVCGYDGACCQTVWDEECVALVNDECAGACPECSVCGDGVCGFDESCVLCAEDCGGCPGDCCYDNGSPGCEATDCQSCVCQLDLECCTGPWDAECVALAASECVDTCECEEQSDCCSPDPGPGCSEAACEECVCALDSFCCEASFDVVCTGLASGLCEDSCPCGVKPTCCQPHPEPGCMSPGCESCVCALDEACCTITWDDACVAQTQDACAADCLECDPCCQETPTLGCQKPECESCVCSLDSFCCETAWDILCVQKATDVCQTECGCIADTDCCSGKLDPGCEEPGCESCVCSIQSECCDGMWGAGCVLTALTQCNPACTCPFKGKIPEGHRCCVPSLQPGCDQPDCESCVCAVDDSCCTTVWDDDCVELSLGDCNGVCSCP